LINIITKKSNKCSLFSADVLLLLVETNIDLGKLNVGKKATALLGLNYFRYNQKIDNDNNFTDVSLSDRISFFKMDFREKENRLFTIAARGVYEDRLVAMCVGRKNTVAVTKSTAKAFIPNEN
jgi:outer membrane receptor for ferrienterochelin and colicins